MKPAESPNEELFSLEPTDLELAISHDETSPSISKDINQHSNTDKEWQKQVTYTKDPPPDADVASGTIRGGGVTKIVDGRTMHINGNEIKLALIKPSKSGSDELIRFLHKECPEYSAVKFHVDSRQKNTPESMTAKVWCHGSPPKDPETSINLMIIESGLAEISKPRCKASKLGSPSWDKPPC